jgi:hypothetical protein
MMYMHHGSLVIDIPLLASSAVSKTTILPNNTCNDGRYNCMCGFVWHRIFHVPDLGHRTYLVLLIVLTPGACATTEGHVCGVTRIVGINNLLPRVPKSGLAATMNGREPIAYFPLQPVGVATPASVDENRCVVLRRPLTTTCVSK